MPQPKQDHIKLGGLRPRPQTYARHDGVAFQQSVPAWQSKFNNLLLKLLIYAAGVVLGTVIALCLGLLIIALHFTKYPLLEPTAVKWGCPQSLDVREPNISTMAMHGVASQHTLVDPPDDPNTTGYWGLAGPIWRRYHSWKDCPNWPDTQKCKQKICNVDFTVDCHDEREIWECKMCFSDEGEIKWIDNALAEHCCEAKRKEEIVWISIGSAFGLLLLLALGGYMFKQTRDKRRVCERDRAIMLQDRELGDNGRSQVDRAHGTVRWTKSVRRVLVLPVSRSRTSSTSDTVNPSTTRARQGSGGSSGGS